MPEMESNEADPAPAQAWLSRPVATSTREHVPVDMAPNQEDNAHPQAVLLWPEQAADPQAFVAWRLTLVTPLAQPDRINTQALLLARWRLATPVFPGSSRALELRYIVAPPAPAHQVQQHIQCYLLARLSDWRLQREDLAAAALQFGQEIGHLLAVTLPTHQFAPVLATEEIAGALRPFPVLSTAEIRHDDIVPGPLPGVFGGVPDADVLVGLLARQRHPTVLAFCLEPADAASALNVLPSAPHLVEQVPSINLHHEPDERVASALAPRDEDLLAQQRFNAQRLAAFRRQVFHLRVQVASSAPIGEAVLGTLAAEVGGPSRLLAQAAWQKSRQPHRGQCHAGPSSQRRPRGHQRSGHRRR